MIIREENPKDYNEIYWVVKSAFKSAEHSDGNEQDLVGELRNGTAYIPELSLVAETNGKIVGHIMFTKASVKDNTVLVLAPLSVLPEYQRNGIGTALIKAGHKTAKRLGYNYSIVLGSEKYYPRLGYVPAEIYGIFSPFKVPKENFMAYKLNDDISDITGVVKYAKEFGID